MEMQEQLIVAGVMFLIVTIPIMIITILGYTFYIVNKLINNYKVNTRIERFKKKIKYDMALIRKYQEHEKAYIRKLIIQNKVNQIIKSVKNKVYFSD